MDIFSGESGIRVKRAVEEGVGGTFNDKKWGHWVEEVAGDYFYTPEQAAERLTTMIRGARDNMASRLATPAVPPTDATRLPSSPPPWWHDHSERELEKYAEAQQETLAIFERADPTTLEEQDALIWQHLETQLRSPHDSELVLEFARFIDPERRGVDRRTVFAGNSANLDPYPAYNAPQGEVSRGFQPLFHVAWQAQHIVWQTGCEPYQAVDFLLSNVHFELPWIVVSPRERSGVISIQVGTPSVPTQDVARAYREAVAWERTVQPDVLVKPPKRRRRPRKRTALLLAFVEEQKPGKKTIEDWHLLRKRWNTEHPTWTFPTPEAMRENHRRAARNAERE